MRLIFVCLAALFAVYARAQPRNLELRDGGELILTADAPNDLRGTFRRGDAVLTFASTVSGETRTVHIQDQKKQSVLHVEVTGEYVLASLFGEAIAAKSERNLTDPSFELTPKFAERSDEQLAALDEQLSALPRVPAYAILPNLSIELVHSQIYGDQFPAAQFLHGLGASSARAQNLAMPDLPNPYELGDTLRVSARPRCTSLNNPKDPNKNDCYGMCGGSCTCWWPVCLTCCGCEGCHTHDWACRITGCDAANLTLAQKIAFRTGCVTFAAFFVARQPCQRFEHPAHTPPC